MESPYRKGCGEARGGSGSAAPPLQERVGDVGCRSGSTLAWATYLSRDLISGGAARDLHPDDQVQFPKHLRAKSVE
ncbi:MAG: hypothetical protein IPN91_11315 [Holophagaceae bacterium]|uniref:Uncharacterized protein n=1 Tax=Candidatus Geothrix odensensis TaxID=2954440 RepID=A0A936K614_9BACT|nr:hypothetical protein [Candidatus Geothrix odensensis]